VKHEREERVPKVSGFEVEAARVRKEKSEAPERASTAASQQKWMLQKT